RLLGPDEALLEYLVTDDSLLVFLATPARVTSIAIGASAGRLASRVRLTRELIVQTRHEPTVRIVALDSLYELLIAPARRTGLLDQARRLLLVPNGVLTYFPFAALRDPGSGRFLIQDFTLIELPSAAALTALRSTQPGASTLRSASVFAP